MQIAKTQLMDALTAVLPAVEKKGDESLINRLVFTGMDVAGYNEQFCIVHPLPTDFNTTVASDETAKIVKRITGKEVDLVYSKDQLNIKGGRIKSRLKTEPESLLGGYVNDIITRAGADTLNWYMLPEDFLTGVALCMYSASNDPTEKHLQCLLMTDNLIVGSDDFRISEYTMVAGLGDTMLIPASVCMEMVKLGGFTEYATDGVLAFFNRPDNVMLAARLTDADYDDYARFFDVEGGVALTLPAAEIAKEIDGVAIMAEGEHDLEKEIRVNIEPGQVVLRGEKDLGWLEATIKKKVDGATKPIDFGINPTFFANILKLTHAVNVGVDRALFTADDGKFRHLISLGIS